MMLLCLFWGFLVVSLVVLVSARFDLDDIVYRLFEMLVTFLVIGAAVGQDCALLEEVCGWINEKATIPVWAKMTPNITDITQVLHSWGIFFKGNPSYCPWRSYANCENVKSEFDGTNLSLSGIGGVETGGDAAEFILLGANTVQVRLHMSVDLFAFEVEALIFL
ncbi:uncharacterized protein A4U43_C08F35280 [Asparagus officinalis]|nr:uncharacterized protein A4U43_C08F35280 [Asparagus officinalis]